MWNDTPWSRWCYRSALSLLFGDAPLPPLRFGTSPIKLGRGVRFATPWYAPSRIGIRELTVNHRIDIKAFDELTLRELHQVLWLRSRVFVVEQEITGVPEVDEHDPSAHHALLWGGDRVVGTTRILLDRDPIKVGRVAVDEERRGEGLGRRMMEAVAEFLGDRHAKLHAQAHLERWYADLGWRRVGENFDIVGIDHVRMDWPPEP